MSTNGAKILAGDEKSLVEVRQRSARMLIGLKLGRVGSEPDIGLLPIAWSFGHIVGLSAHFRSNYCNEFAFLLS